MNLPELNQLNEDQSSYITFSKYFTDFENSIRNKTSCYFTKMVALELPVWQNPNFYLNLSSLDVNSTNPNVVLPKIIQYYMENIIRQDISIDDSNIPEIVELAFWKTLSKMGLSDVQTKNTVTFINSIATSNFIKIENNNGWSEIVGQIPNKCKSLTTAWKTLPNIKNTVQCSDSDVALYDNGLNQLLFSETLKEVIDFNNCVYSDVEVKDFNFNTLLLYYKDSENIEKLHGINFIYPFEDNVTEWKLPLFTQKTNTESTIGYQFKFNMKTCNNDATRTAVYAQDDHTHWNTFSETLSKLNSFLEQKSKETITQII